MSHCHHATGKKERRQRKKKKLKKPRRGDDLLDVIEGCDDAASVIDVLVGAELSVLRDEEAVRAVLGVSLHHLILVVLLESGGSGGVEHRLLRKKSAHICDDLQELAGGSVQKEVVRNVNKLCLRRHCRVFSLRLYHQTKAKTKNKQ